jgi:hypothetical protein
MSFERYGASVLAVIAFVVIVLAAATVWLFVTDPVGVATAINDGEISPLVRDLADALLRALQALLQYL